MPLEPELIALMLDEIVIEPAVSGPDKFNNFTFGPAVTVRCKLTRNNRQVRDRSGREVTSTVSCILATPELNVTSNDRLTLPDGSHPAILEILASSDDVGPYWLEIRA